MAKIGIIGMGNMGYAILHGLLRTFDKKDLVFTDHNPDKMKRVGDETGVAWFLSNAECANAVDYLILAVKPQCFQTVLKNIESVITREKIVISLAPGITISQLETILGEDKRVVRAMPNTPAFVGEAMTAMSYACDRYTSEEEETLEAMFTSFGRIKKVEESLISAVICVSGSAPAFAYLFIEALADSGVKYGLSREMAYEMAAQALLGSAKMVLETKEHPARLKDQVCSPSGTTIEGVSALEEYGFRNSIMKAADACYKQSEQMKGNK